MMDNGIIVKDLTKKFKGAIILNKVSFEVETGENVSLTGPSGSGKTTLLRLIAGLELPDEGEIQIENRVVSKPDWLLAPRERGIGFVFQKPALWPHMTVAQNILFGMHGLQKNEAQDLLEELLDKFSITKLSQCYPNEISGGEARRVSVARALAPKPRYLLMDEPLTNLDMELKERILRYVKEFVKQIKAGLIYVTHDMDEAKEISDRILSLQNGVIGGS